jgi:mono/diheme cytochrome c family protein
MRLVTAAILLIVATAAAACTTGTVASGSTAPLASSESAASGSAAGGVARSGDSFALMSQQYTPRAGPVAATGASAWVTPAPEPAFVASGPLPPADPPAPDPIEAASRQAAATARPVSGPTIAGPPAATPGAPAAPDPALRTAGLALFNSYSCGTCHSFADADASGSIGPSLDRNPRLTKEFAVDVMTTGRGAMPSFAGQMSEAEIAALAGYLAAFTRK